MSAQLSGTSAAGSQRPSDSLDLFWKETATLAVLYGEWSSMIAGVNGPQVMDLEAMGKAILEHAVLRLAAREDVVRVLRDARREDMAALMEHRARIFRTLVGRLAQTERATGSAVPRASSGLARHVGCYYREFRVDVVTPDLRASHVAGVIGPDRSALRSEASVRKHASLRTTVPPSPGENLPGRVARLRACWRRRRSLARSGTPLSTAGPADGHDAGRMRHLRPADGPRAAQ